MIGTSCLLRPLFPTLLVGAAAGLFVWYPISDGDIFWHLAAGREIISTGAIPRSDPFAYTSKPEWQWIDLHWLYQVTMHAVESAAGVRGILVANSVLFACAVSLLFTVATRFGAAWLSVPLWIAALYEVRYLVPHRPIAVSLLLFSLFYWCLDRYAAWGKRRYLVALVPLQIVWVNSQPLFVLGLAIYGAWWCGMWLESRRSQNAVWFRAPGVFGAMIASALVAATFINPYGVDAWTLAFRLFDRIDPSHANLFSRHIPENAPLWTMVGTPDVRYVWAIGAMTVLAMVLIAIRPRRMHWPHLLIAAAMLFLAVRAQRNIVLYVFAVLPLISPMLSIANERCRKIPVVPFVAALCGLLAVVDVSNHVKMLTAIRGTGPIAPFSFPVAGAEYLQRHPVEGNLFNADRYGGYVLWYSKATRKVFADTRYAIRPSAFLAEYLEIIDNPARFEPVCRRFGITAALVPLSPVPRYLPLARSLLTDPAWRLVCCDGAEALFIRDSLACGGRIDLSSASTVDSLATSILTRWHKSPLVAREGLSYLADFLYAMGYEWGALRVRGRQVGR